MKFRQRWMPLPWGVFIGAFMLVLTWIGVYSSIYYPDDKPSLRVFLPFYGVGVYLAIALLVNWRTVVVTPAGLSVSVWPFLIRMPRRLRRDQIRYCYIRKVDIYDEGDHLETYYSAGVQSLAGEQIDASTPHSTAEGANVAARQIASILNQFNAGPPLEVWEVQQLPEPREVLAILTLMAVWLAIAIAAVFIGFEWEERVNRSSLAPQLSNHRASLRCVVARQHFQPPA
jgi:hypothetical protein